MRSPTAKVLLTLDMNLPAFDEKTQKLLRYAIGAYLDISPRDINIASVNVGRLNVAIELAAKHAEILLTEFKKKDPTLIDFLAPFVVLDISRKTARHEQIQLPEEIAVSQLMYFYELIGQLSTIAGKSSEDSEPDFLVRCMLRWLVLALDSECSILLLSSRRDVGSLTYSIHATHPEDYFGKKGAAFSVSDDDDLVKIAIEEEDYVSFDNLPINVPHSQFASLYIDRAVVGRFCFCERDGLLIVCNRRSFSPLYATFHTPGGQLEGTYYGNYETQAVSLIASETATAINHLRLRRLYEEETKDQRLPKRQRIAQSVREEVLRRSGGQCAICGRETSELQIDYIVPVAKGGDDSFENLRTVCPSCNVALHRQPEAVIQELRERATQAYQLERQVAEVFGKLGYALLTGATGPDGGVELVARKPDPATGIPLSIIIECKSSSHPLSKVQVAEFVRKFSHYKATLGVIVTNRPATIAAQAAAGDWGIRVITLDELGTLASDLAGCEDG